MKQSTTESKLAPAEAVRALTVKIRALEAHAAEFHAEHLALDAAGARAVAPSGRETPEITKHKWLNGFGGEEPVESPDTRLHDVLRNRAGLDAALDELHIRLFDAQAAVAREWLAANQKHWTVVQLGRCRALLMLRKANTEAEKFRRELAKVCPVPIGLQVDRVSGIFSADATGDFIQRFLEDCATADIIDASEITR